MRYESEIEFIYFQAKIDETTHTNTRICEYLATTINRKANITVRKSIEFKLYLKKT